MKGFKIIIIVGLLLYLAALSTAATLIYKRYITSDPLRAERLELEKSKLDRLTEQEKQRTEEAKRETARTLAAIERQARLEANQGVNAAVVIFAVTWRLTPTIILSAALIGGGVYLWRRPVLFEFESIRAYLPRHAIAEATQQALITQERKAMVEALAYAETVTQGRIEQILGAIKAMPKQQGVNLTQNALPITTATRVPTFAELLDAHEIAEGKMLLMGFTSENIPQRRTIKDIKALSVAGQQGSGKTASIAYLLTSMLILNKKTEEFVIDPHWQHPEGLGMMVKPLEGTGRLHLINPVEITQTIEYLDARLDKRLAGIESSDTPIVIVVDELARIGKTHVFTDTVLPFVERCTEETRKANYLFIGGSQKWNARHFGNKADIRACINSLLVHRIKPSQADLLLEDRENAKLMKHVTRPGQALMATSHDADPSIVSMPFITRADIERVANMLAHDPEAEFGEPKQAEMPASKQPETTTETAAPTFGGLVRERLAAVGLSQNKLAEMAGISKKDMSLYMNGKPVPDDTQTQIFAILEEVEKQRNTTETPEETQEETI